MPKGRERQRTYGAQELLSKPPAPAEPPETVWNGLTAVERRFVMGYLEHGDPRKAFIDVGLFHDQKHPRQLAYNYLRRPKIQRAVARGQAFYAEQVGLHAWQILAGLHGAAFHDPACLYEEDGEGGWQLRKMAEWPLESRLAVQKIRVEESTSESGMTRKKTEIEFADRLHALQLLGRHLKLFEKNTREIAPFTLVLNTNSEPIEKRVGETIEGIGLKIHLPSADER